MRFRKRRQTYHHIYIWAVTTESTFTIITEAHWKKLGRMDFKNPHRVTAPLHDGNFTCSWNNALNATFYYLLNTVFDNRRTNRWLLLPSQSHCLWDGIMSFIQRTNAIFRGGLLLPSSVSALRAEYRHTEYQQYLGRRTILVWPILNFRDTIWKDLSPFNLVSDIDIHGMRPEY